MVQTFLYIPLNIIVVYFMRFVSADCVQSNVQCCPGYLWNEHHKKCERCSSGFSGRSCKLMCPYPSYGLDCQQTCKCEKYLCNFQYGCVRYNGCEDGLFGPLCLKKCPYPSYGKECQKICSCDIETCNYKEGCVANLLFQNSQHGFLSSADSTVSRDPYSKISSKVSTQEINTFPNKSVMDQLLYSKNIKDNESVSSTSRLTQLKVTPNTESELSNGRSGEQTVKTDIKDGKNVSSDQNLWSILIISLNAFAIVIVCCIFGLCAYCKRRQIFHKLFEVNKDGYESNRNRVHEKRLFFQELLLKRPEMELGFTNTDENSSQRFTNQTNSGSLEQRGHFEHDIYENDPDPYLVPENNVSEPEYHQYLTVV